MTEHERYRLSVKDAAAQLGVSIWTLYRMCKRREIDHIATSGKVTTRVVNGEQRAVRVTGNLKFSQAGIDAWVAGHRVSARPTEVAPSRPTERPSLPMPAERRFAR